MATATEEKDGSVGSSDEAIGRPGPWREGRYQEGALPIKDSVVRNPDEGPPDTISTTVTRRDYESLEKPARKPAA